MSYTDTRTRYAKETHLEVETEDSLGYDKGSNEHSELDLPAVANHFGPVSESLVVALKAMSFTITGDDLSGTERTYLLSISNEKWMNAELMLFGHRTGRRDTIAVKSDNGGWYYTNKFLNKLQEATGAGQWLVKVHTYHRV